MQQTANRLSGPDFSSMLVVSNQDHGDAVRTQLASVDADIEAILVEPKGRNTSTAAALAAAWLMQEGRDELILLVPSDHIIGDREAFTAAIDTGAREASRGMIVTFGVRPTEPNTQYGYIEVALDKLSKDGPLPIARFVEKPDAERAAEYLASGRYFWNSGIFLVKASTLLEEMAEFLPASLDAILRSVASAKREGDVIRPEPSAFGAAENISIDHGIMEKTNKGMVVPVEMSWSDVGSWDAVWKLGAKDENNNMLQGDVVAIDTSGSLIRNEGGTLVATVGLENMVVVAVEDALFVAPRARAAEVKLLVERLKSKRRA